jgi:hypothetical protein
MKTRLAYGVGTVLIASVVACGGADDPKGESLGDTQDKVVWSDAGDGGWVTGPNCYADGGPYNLCNHNCHHAANCGLDAGNDGIISCDGYANGDLGGHTVNWDTVACAGDAGAACKKYCISDPQSSSSTAACCWEQPSGGAIDVSSGAGQACVNQICGVDGGGTALDAGVPWDLTPNDCAASSSSNAECGACCNTNADYYRSMFDGGIAPEPYNSQINDYVVACANACNAAF